MTLIACGLNHKTAPLELREQLAPTAEEQSQWLHELCAQNTVGEAALLSTCNRTELYATVQSEQPQQMIDILAKQYHIAPKTLQQHAYLYTNTDAIRHMLRVACGTDSMIVGEPQIFGQLKQAYAHAKQWGTIKTPLSSLFQRIFAASKRIRTQTLLGQQPLSVAYIAAKLANDIFDDMSACRCLLIGTGDTIDLTARYLQQFGITQFTIAGRSENKTTALANIVHGHGIQITEVMPHLHQADLIITATACPVTFITAEMINGNFSQSPKRPLYLIDLAVPRDIEAAAGELDHVTLYNIDDLQATIKSNQQERETARSHAEILIEQELNYYEKWQRINRASKTIHSYRQNMQNIAATELQFAMEKLNQDGDAKAALQQLHHRLVNKILHQPTLRIRQAAADEEWQLLNAIDELFTDL